MIKKSIKKNYIYNSIYQIFTLIIPLITTPYLSKVLTPIGIGKYSYTYSIVSFFILFAQLGLGYYAQREIAKKQYNKHDQTITFVEIMIIKLITTIMCLVLFITLCLTNFFQEYTSIMWYWILLIVSQFFDVSFLFQGNEDFKKTVFRNIFIKLLGIVMIFVFVKKPEDVWIYVLSISLSNLLGAVSLWFYIPKYLTKINKKDLNLKRHIGPTISFFIPTIAAVIYSYLDKTIMGNIITDTYVNSSGKLIKISELEIGFYEQTEKIIKVGTSLLTALGTVMLPRNSMEYSNGNLNQLKKNISSAFGFIFMIGFPIMMGLAAISNNLIPWFLGEEFKKCCEYLIIFSPLVLLIGIDNILGIQYLMTTDRETKYTIAVIIGILVNLILNILLIPKLYGMGAIISSLISEVVIIFIMCYFVRKEIDFKSIIKSSKNYMISSIVMYLTVCTLQLFVNSGMIQTFILILFGMAVYFIMLILLKDELLIDNIKKIILKRNLISKK